MLIQLELFESKTESEILKEEVAEIRETTSKVRKKLFADHAKLARLVLELHERLAIIEKNICTGTANRENEVSTKTEPSNIFSFYN